MPVLVMVGLFVNPCNLLSLFCRSWRKKMQDWKQCLMSMKRGQSFVSGVSLTSRFTSTNQSHFPIFYIYSTVADLRDDMIIKYLRLISKGRTLVKKFWTLISILCKLQCTVENYSWFLQPHWTVNSREVSLKIMHA